MTWRSFTYFVEMRKDGRTDSTYRNYDLLAKGSSNEMVKKAVCRIDNENYRKHEAPYLLGMIASRLRATGLETDQFTLHTYLVEWFVWDRITRGEITKWPYRRRIAHA